jgi:hypothetical protein
MLKNHKMAGATDGYKFCYALDKTKNSRLMQRDQD